MKKIISLALVLAVLSFGLPVNSQAAEEPGTHDTKRAAAELPEGAEAGGLKVTPGVVAAAVSVLGFIALAASVDSGDATPTTTSHTN